MRNSCGARGTIPASTGTGWVRIQVDAAGRDAVRVRVVVLRSMPKPSVLFDLSGRVALVTGSSQGLGYALARGLAEAGACVVLNGRDAAKLEQAAGTLRTEGCSVATAVFDVTDSAAVAAAVARIERDQGPIDILVTSRIVEKSTQCLLVSMGTYRNYRKFRLVRIEVITADCLSAYGSSILPRVAKLFDTIFFYYIVE